MATSAVLKQGEESVLLPGAAFERDPPGRGQLVVSELRPTNDGTGEIMKFDIPTSYRKNRLIHEHVHDLYKTKSKPPEPTVCPICYAVFKEGWWQWAEFWPIEAHRQMCQTCHRTRDVVSGFEALASQHR
jgi:hypothetical protein